MKCPECGGTGELEVKVGLMDCPVDCIFCDGTGEVPDKQEEEQMEYTVAKRGWVLLNDKNKVMAEGTKADIEKVAFEKVLKGHTIKGVEQVEELSNDDTTTDVETRPLI